MYAHDIISICICLSCVYSVSSSYTLIICFVCVFVCVYRYVFSIPIKFKVISATIIIIISSFDYRHIHKQMHFHNFLNIQIQFCWTLKRLAKDTQLQSTKLELPYNICVDNYIHIYVIYLIFYVWFIFFVFDLYSLY